VVVAFCVQAVQKKSGAGMKTAYQIAKEIGVSPQAVYKKITPEVLNRFNNVVQRGKKRFFDEEAEKAIKSMFVNDTEGKTTIEPVVEPVEPTIEPVVEPDKNWFNNQNKSEVEYLREQLDVAYKRNHELAMKISELTRNNQILLGMEKRDKMPWWKKVFRKKDSGAE
jgi:ribosomal protein S13